jgi:hypothetical protein
MFGRLSFEVLVRTLDDADFWITFQGFKIPEIADIQIGQLIAITS